MNKYKRDSIWEDVMKHWERVYFRELEEPMGSRACALCRVYAPIGLSGGRLRTNKLVCEGCPISIAVGTPSCMCTPYTKVESCAADLEDYLEDLELNPEKFSLKSKEYYRLVFLFRAAVRKQIKFLARVKDADLAGELQWL